DSIAGLFAVGLAPRGSADPFALRRAAIGIVQNLIAARRSFSLRHGLEQAGRLLPVPMSTDALNSAHAFIVERARQQLLDEGFRYDVIDAVLAEQGDDPWRARLNVAQLSEWTRREDWSTLLAAYARCARIIKSARQEAPFKLDSAYQDPEPAAQELTAALEALPPAPSQDIDALMNCLSRLVGPITTFFDRVLVMAEEEIVRRSRLALVGRVVALAGGLADLSKLEGF
ncbi:MAG: glycine--tRNA ligase subunit beta, partial [Anaerolineae bacterium]|nr:glycine--tRNA ligase subunit beta [Thermoflexales bacterium]MDW8408296.1 glycine--tRNA ligase subunit beta [Anaerolineae bacterium]